MRKSPNTYVLLLLLLLPFSVWAQRNVIINMAPIDGLPLTPDNILNYQVHATGSGNVQVRGTLRYRNSDMNLSYTYTCMLRDGINIPGQIGVHPQWQFSSSALQEVFMSYKMLPEGTYEYCVTITPVSGGAEIQGMSYDECLYHRSDDLFLINLIDPENNAKLHEYNPMLSWIANSVLAGQLTYRLRVAEIKQGQNPENAIMRNQPVYDERNLQQNSLVYPIYAKPLEANKHYAWTVDAYYKNLLLGGAETWQFTIIDDTPSVAPQANRSYIDISRENGTSKLYILGELKLKYVLDKTRTDELTLELHNDKGEKIVLKPEKLGAVYGDNRYVLDLRDSCSLTHMAAYELLVTPKSGSTYRLPFWYLDPAYTKQ